MRSSAQLEKPSLAAWQRKATEPREAAAGTQGTPALFPQEGQLEEGASVLTTPKRRRRRRRSVWYGGVFSQEEEMCGVVGYFQRQTRSDDKHTFCLPRLAPPWCFLASEAGKALWCLPCARTAGRESCKVAAPDE